jgi:hypothetical protein
VNTLDVVLLAIAVVVVAIVVVGSSIARRRAEAGDARLRERLAAANEALAQAHAADKGWDKALLEAAARSAAGPVDELLLVSVIDNPGTDQDEAVFQVVKDGETRTIGLRRTGDTWVAS